ncbi:hypothetical protein IPL68_05865 [Candidatus Saccharibacteria bacterium]|nr:MAG: hypothetical protein IPL68_05865 [Candidatus Saccharibacteria bacterium]
MTLQPLDLPTPTDDNRFNAVDPLDGRYYDPEIAKYLSERTRILTQAHRSCPGLRLGGVWPL